MDEADRQSAQTESALAQLASRTGASHSEVSEDAIAAAEAIRALTVSLITAQDPGVAALIRNVLGSLSELPSCATRFREAGEYPMASHPVFGRQNPVSPDLTVSINGLQISATAIFGVTYEAFRGVVFGGAIAAVFDAVAGCAAALAIGPAVAESLTTHFLRPTPTHTEVSFHAEASVVSNSSGHALVTAWAAVQQSEQWMVTCRAEGAFRHYAIGDEPRP